ncbi:MAG: FlgB family protein [Roseovarius sp.]|nr:FlgB family protein [Roseovarius sp.]
MFEKIEIFRMAQAMAVHAGARQSLVAQNMANADTPGYAARDIKPFQALYEGGEASYAPRATRAGHLFGETGAITFDPLVDTNTVSDPNGNSVSLETEMLKAVDVKRQHDRALAIYKSSLGVLRSALGRR